MGDYPKILAPGVRLLQPLCDKSPPFPGWSGGGGGRGEGGFTFIGALKVILLEGVAGAGKTTLTWYACKEWAAGRIFEHINLLIFVPLSNLDVHSARELADLIPYDNKEVRTSVASAIFESRDKSICFSLEGCDEAPSSMWDSFLSKFIGGKRGRTLIPNISIVLTSRPTISVKLNSFLTGKGAIKGFKLKSLDEYYDRVFQKDDKERKQKVLEALEMKPELCNLCYLPLNAAILVHVHSILKGKLP